MSGELRGWMKRPCSNQRSTAQGQESLNPWSNHLAGAQIWQVKSKSSIFSVNSLSFTIWATREAPKRVLDQCNQETGLCCVRRKQVNMKKEWSASRTLRLAVLSPYDCLSSWCLNQPARSWVLWPVLLCSCVYWFQYLRFLLFSGLHFDLKFKISGLTLVTVCIFNEDYFSVVSLTPD